MTVDSGLRPAFFCARGAVVIGGGPAGLMAAEVLAEAGVPVDLFDGMPSVGRKFLLAGRGGLNLTHSEVADTFVARYRDRRDALEPTIRAFGPEAVRAWARGLGVDTFVGTSGRVFPRDMKAAPLLRAWLHRLRLHGVRLAMRHRWRGWDAQGRLQFDTPQGGVTVEVPLTVLALGGASWSRLGSDGAWLPWLRARGVSVRELTPSNCGFDVGWSEHFSSRHAGAPMKGVAIAWQEAFGQGTGRAEGSEVSGGAQGSQGEERKAGKEGTEGAVRGGWQWRKGEFVVTAGGVEGSVIYVASAALRDGIARDGHATFLVDLLPAHTPESVAAALAHPRGTRSLATHLKSRLGLDGVKRALVHECLTADVIADTSALARALKAVPVTVRACRPIDEAISSAGGVPFEALDEHLMLRAAPGVFCAGEMLDWEAPTGGYLLTACLATGRAAGLGALARWRDGGLSPPAGAAGQDVGEQVGAEPTSPDRSVGVKRRSEASP